MTAIRTNISALNAFNFTKANNSQVADSLEKLASGLRINRAADDASGLAISEKMKALIRGLETSVSNAQDGISLLQVGEGALQEVQDIINRMKELSVRSGNGTFDNPVDRDALQKEFEQLTSELDRIANNTNFNGVRIFRDTPLKTPPGKQMTVQELMENTKPGEFNIVYTEEGEVENQIITGTQAATGSTSTSTAWDSTNIRNILKTQIIPNVVKNMLKAYPAFGYLENYTIGIGLHLYSDPDAFESASAYTYWNSSGGVQYQNFKLNVNMASVGDLSIEKNRNELEYTIAHELMHSFMQFTLTNGMSGSADRFPTWFVEGMAQTTSGGMDWVKSSSGLGIDIGSSLTEIRNALANHKLSAGDPTVDTGSHYGTGYLGCMYLGYLANGGTGPLFAQGISNGLSKILAQLIEGKSLDETIQTVSGGRYTSTKDFQNKFADDGAQFTHDLFVAIGKGEGGVISGDLTDNDLIANNTVTNVRLFELDINNEIITNFYSSDEEMISGGTTTKPGNKPTADYDASKIPDIPGSDGSGLHPTTRLFTVTGGTEGTDYEYDNATGRLTILRAGNYTISGGRGVNLYGDAVSGQISVKDGLSGVNITLSGVDIDHSGNAEKSAMEIGTGSQVTVNLSGSNALISGNGRAGLQVNKNADLTITGSGSLMAQGGKGWVVNHEGVNGSAGIGGAYNQESGNITINGGNVTALVADQSFGTGIGSGSGATCGDITVNNGTIDIRSQQSGGLSVYCGIGAGYSNGRCGNININGGNVTVTGLSTGAGIGSSEQGHCGDITVRAGTIKIPQFTTTMFLDYVGIGAGAEGSCQNIHIIDGDITSYGGRLAAGIGSGYKATCGDITIDGGTVKAIGQNQNTSGIGAGSNATVGNITINGGNITATGTVTASGIGTSINGKCGNIEINGGEITASSTERNGAGIGSGYKGECGSIIINDGTVTATAGQYSVGIGAGRSGKSGDIEIHGGTVTATANTQGCGIGTGIGENNTTKSVCGDITIDGGSVHATGANGSAGIGSSFYHSTSGKITINGGYVYAEGGQNSAAIGVGNGGSSNGSCGDVALLGGVIDAVEGTGWYTNRAVEVSTGRKLTVDGANLKATNDIIYNAKDSAGGAVYNYKFALTTGDVIHSIEAKSDSGTIQKLTENLRHDPTDSNNSYLWLRGEDQDVTYVYTASDGKTYSQTVHLTFEPPTRSFSAATVDPPVETTPPTPPTSSTGSFTVTGGTLGTDYSYDSTSGQLTILTNKALTISGTTSTEQIVVKSGITADLTLNGVNIDQSANSGKAAIELQDGSNVRIKLAGNNVLKSGADAAGLQMDANASLLILGNGTLDAQGGAGAAGIGSGKSGSCGNLAIESGTIKATGGAGAAGIGKGQNGTSGDISLGGGIIDAFAGAGYDKHVEVSSGKRLEILRANLKAGTDGKISTVPEGSYGKVYYYKLDLPAGASKISEISANANFNISTWQKTDLRKDGDNYLWLLGEDQDITVTYTDASGVSKTDTVSLEFDSTNKVFKVKSAPPVTAGLFTVTGGTLGVDYSYDDTTGELKILTDKAMTISGGKGTNSSGGTRYGQIVVSSNANLTLDGVNINQKTNYNCAFLIEQNHNVSITLKGTTTLTSSDDYAGLQVNKGAKLTIGGTGTLTANGGSTGEIGIASSGAGIGGGYMEDSGDIVINSGTINANGSFSAGIGSGQGGKGGSITINGGNVTAKSTAGAAIGSGYQGSCGNITINNGDIQATASNGGAAIGSGDEGDCGDILINNGTIKADAGIGSGIGGGVSGNCGNITILHGNIQATGRAYGAAIGAGFNEDDTSRGICGNITIDGLDTIIVAISKSAAGIGTGSNGNSTCGNILIKNGNITATAEGNYAAGIGTGSVNKMVTTPEPPKTVTCGTITIQGGTVNASGSGAGIGTGEVNSAAGSLSCGDILISGGTVTAKSTEKRGSAGIGSGHFAGNLENFDIRITGGVVTATGGLMASGIGTGNHSNIGNIEITGGKIIASTVTDPSITQSGVGIGSGTGSSCKNITISGGTVTANGVAQDVGIGAGSEATCGNITISNGTVTATGGELGAGIGSSDQKSTCGNITISGGTVSANGGMYGGAGIGAGTYDTSFCGDIVISGGTVTAIGVDFCAGIGTKDGNCGNITISGGVVDAKGGDYADSNIQYHHKDKTVQLVVTGSNLKAGDAGEGKDIAYDAYDPDGERVYAYKLQLPSGAEILGIKSKSETGDEKEWKKSLRHSPSDTDNSYIWMRGEQQEVTYTYKDTDGKYYSKTVHVEFKSADEKFNVIQVDDAVEVAPPDPPNPPDTPDTPDVPNPPGPDDPDVPDPPGPDVPDPPDPPEPVRDEIILQIGPKFDSHNRLRIKRFYFSSEALGLDQCSISTQERAWNTQPILSNALNKVSSMRAYYGSVQNRLEHTITNEENYVENLSAAHSRIRDTDMAKEMMRYTQMNVLTQSAQAMLAQANQIPQSFLQLLQ